MEDKMNHHKEKYLKRKNAINNILFHSYAVFFGAVVLGLFFDTIIHFDIFSNPVYQNIGLFMIIFGTVLIYWSQKTTSVLKKVGDKDSDFFFHGPYKYTRNPTNLGLTLMSLGLGFLINSLFSVVFIVIVYFISKFIFIKKQDLILEKRYGNTFLEYKKRVRDWL